MKMNMTRISFEGDLERYIESTWLSYIFDHSGGLDLKLDIICFVRCLNLNWCCSNNPCMIWSRAAFKMNAAGLEVDSGSQVGISQNPHRILLISILSGLALDSSQDTYQNPFKNLIRKLSGLSTESFRETCQMSTVERMTSEIFPSISILSKFSSESSHNSHMIP